MSEEVKKSIPVKVALRIRPLIQREINDGCQSCIRTVPGESQVILGQDRAFTYDYVFGETSSQLELYDKVSMELMGNVFKGVNATILAYGQTGSGKTFSMGGCYESSLSGDQDEMGIIPRVLIDIFKGVEERQEREFFIRVSYMEIYKEEVFDLLCAQNQREALTIKEEANGEIKIPGLKEIKVTGYEDTMCLLSSGSVGRTTGATAMNSTSSRSHAIFTLYMDQRSKTDENDACAMKFQLVDLAGSERCKRTGAEGDRFKEGVNINKGLLVLGNVISALGKKQSHIPYRDAKLTRILKDSLGGNSHTVMIACVSPADTNVEETLNTLRYADRARKIKNKPIINRDPQAAENMRLKMLVRQLQDQLMGLGSSTVVGSVTSNCSMPIDDHKDEKIKQLKAEKTQLAFELHESLRQRTQMMENLLMMETRMEKLKENVGIDVDLLSSSMNAEFNPKVRAELEKLLKLTETIKEEDEVLETVAAEDDDEDKMPEQLFSLTENTTANEHLIRQADLHRQLTEVTSMLKEKQNIAEKMNQADAEMETVKLQYTKMMNDLEEKVVEKQKEIDELKNSQNNTKNTVTKLSEQRRQRLQQLEGEIQQLKKKMIEQNKILKLKQKSDTHVAKLNSEIQEMKQQRVQLMKQMKTETASFQKWKKEKDKEVCKLKQKDSKREFLLKKLQNDHDKQQVVLKRKNAEAIAANKRLRDALSKRNEIEAEKTNKLEKYDATSIGLRVRKWLSRELDLKFSMTECKYHLEELMENRKSLTQSLQQLSNQLEEGIIEKYSCPDDTEEEIDMHEEQIRQQMKAVQVDIDMLNMQIGELQQKIVETDQDMKVKSTWQNLHTMTEAKCALKFLLEQAVIAKAENSKTRFELKNSQVEDGEKISRLQELEMTNRDLKCLMGRSKSRHEREMDKLRNEYEEKILYLLNADQSNQGNETPKGTMKGTPKYDHLNKEKIKILESKVKNVEDLKSRLEETESKLQAKDKECEILQRNITCGIYQNRQFNLMPDVNSNSSPFFNPTPKAKHIQHEMFSLDSTFTLEGEEPRSSHSPLTPPCPATVTISKSKAHRITRSSSGLKIIDEKQALNISSSLNSSNGDLMNSGKEGLMKRKSGDEGSNLDSSNERKKKRKRTLLSQDIGYFNNLTE